MSNCLNIYCGCSIVDNMAVIGETLKNVAAGAVGAVAGGALGYAFMHEVALAISYTEAEQIEMIEDCAGQLDKVEQVGPLPEQCEGYDYAFILLPSGDFLLPASNTFKERELPGINTDEHIEDVAERSGKYFGTVLGVGGFFAGVAMRYDIRNRRQQKHSAAVERDKKILI